ncbi:MAG: Gfo/Idh/MocA family oxidoreductase, partial [Planctomycetota bacterium]
EVLSVAAAGGRGETVFEDETTLAAAMFEGGPPASFGASYATDLYSFSILGTRGRIQLTSDHVVVKGDEPFVGDVFDYAAAGREVALPIADMTEAIERKSDEVEIHGAFARWLDGRGDFWCTGERGVRDMRVVDAVHRSLREGTWVTVG